MSSFAIDEVGAGKFPPKYKLRRRYRFLDYNPCMTKLVQTQMDAAASEYLWLRRVQAAGAAGSDPAYIRRRQNTLRIRLAIEIDLDTASDFAVQAHLVRLTQLAGRDPDDMNSIARMLVGLGHAIEIGCPC